MTRDDKNDDLVERWAVAWAEWCDKALWPERLKTVPVKTASFDDRERPERMR